MPDPLASTTRLLDGGRRERLLVGVLAILIVLLRCFMPTYYEGYYFDSDQAIVGLMAKHTAEFRRFPLFYYGLNYLLAVQAWIIAPFFWLARPSVGVMRLPLVILNVGVALALVTMIAREMALRPAVAFAAALPFVVPTPATSAFLLQVAGASIEPFVYVLVLWRLRRRPIAFGVLLAIAYLHREFGVFALPAMLAAEARRREFWSVSTLRRIGWIAVGFGAAWLVVDDVRMHLAGAPLGAQVASLGNQMCVDAATLPPRAQSLVTQALPRMYGAARVPVASFGMNTPVAAGSLVVGALLLAALALIVIRLFIAVVSGWRADQDAGPGQFGVYLACIGAFTACAYPLSCNVALNGTPMLRYLLLALLLPVGLCAAFLRCERSALLRTAVVAILGIAGTANLFDNVRVIAAARREPPGSEHRILTDYLLSRGIRYARAIYWDAYVVDFLSRERVTVASVDITRIPEYEQEVAAHAAVAFNLERLPCTGGVTVASWCISR